VATYREGFDPHHWEGCFIFRCKKKECSYIMQCYAAQQRDQKETEEFIEALNKRLLEGFDVNMLSPIEKAKLEHAIEKHGVRFDSERGIYYFEKAALKNIFGRGASLYR